MAFTQEGLICPVCRGFVFREADNGDLVCTQCGTLSEQSHKATIEEDLTAIQKDRFGVSVRRVLPSQKKEKRRKKKDPILSLHHILYIVQKMLMKQVQSILPFIPCPEAYDSLCKNIWLSLVLKSKPYLSTFTHIYPYTMMRIKTPAGLSAPLTPKSEQSPSPPPDPSDAKLFSDMETPEATQQLDSAQLSQSLQNSIREAISIPQSPKRDASLLFSGMELPESLRSFLSQTQPEAVKKRLKPDSPKRKGKSPKRSRRNSLTSAVVKPPTTAIQWDDDEIVLGYQLQMSSLLGVLYAASRILQLPFFARDFELAASDGIIPYINIIQYMEDGDSKYIRPIKHWFSKIVIPNANSIESEAWSICNEIGVCFAPLPMTPILSRLGMILQFPQEVTELVQLIIKKDRSVIQDEEDDSPILVFNDLTELEWNKRKYEFENASLSRLCEQSTVYCAALFVLSTFLLKKESFIEKLSSVQCVGFGLESSVHLPMTTHHMSVFNFNELDMLIQRMEGIMNASVTVPVDPMDPMDPKSEAVVENSPNTKYPIFYGLKSYSLKQMTTRQQNLVHYVSYNLEISISILLAHIRSVEYILRSKEQAIVEKRKEDLLQCYL